MSVFLAEQANTQDSVLPWVVAIVGWLIVVGGAGWNFWVWHYKRRMSSASERECLEIKLCKAQLKEKQVLTDKLEYEMEQIKR